MGRRHRRSRMDCCGPCREGVTVWCLACGVLRPPVPVVLAASARPLPGPGALAAGGRYEPKWDGFRGLTFTASTPNNVFLQSRQGKNLTPGFPDIAAAI